MEQLDDHLWCRWFRGRNREDSIWEPATFSPNRARWLAGDVARGFFDQGLAQARERGLWSDEPCTVDGTLLAAWAGQKRVTRRAAEPPSAPPDDPGNPSVACHGERRTNATPASTTDPEARLDKKATGQEATLCDLGHALLAPRHGLGVEAWVTQATGRAEREAALAMGEAIAGRHRVTLGAAKPDDTRDVVHELRALPATPLWHRLPLGGPVLWMGARPAIQGRPSVSSGANGSQRSSAG